MHIPRAVSSYLVTSSSPYYAFYRLSRAFLWPALRHDGGATRLAALLRTVSTGPLPGTRKYLLSMPSAGSVLSYRWAEWKHELASWRMPVTPATQREGRGASWPDRGTVSVIPPALPSACVVYGCIRNPVPCRILDATAAPLGAQLAGLRATPQSPSFSAPIISLLVPSGADRQREPHPHSPITSPSRRRLQDRDSLL